MSEIQQEIRYGGSNFSIEGVRKYTKEGFLERNLPLLHIMPDVPKEDKEGELIALWELCGKMLGTVEQPIEEEEVDDEMDGDNFNSPDLNE
jgi:hypothetical protein